MIRRALISGFLAVAIATVCWSTSWDHVLYVGGTVPVKTGGYDWNTTLTVESDSIVVAIVAPTVFSKGQTVRIKPSQVMAIWYGASAYKHVAEVPGAHLPSKPPSLFGMMAGSDASMAIVYEQPDGKKGALLLQSPFTPTILLRLKEVSGKVMEKEP